MVIISARNVIILREKISLDLEIFVLGVYKKEYPGKKFFKTRQARNKQKSTLTFSGTADTEIFVCK